MSQLKSRNNILDLENTIPFINSNLNDTPKNNFIFLNNSIEYAVNIPVSILETSAWLSALNKINNGCDTESQTPDTFNSSNRIIKKMKWFKGSVHTSNNLSAACWPSSSADICFSPFVFDIISALILTFSFVLSATSVHP